MSVGARTYADVSSYPVADGLELDDSGYVLAVDESGNLDLASDTDEPFAVNYISSEDQDGYVQALDEGREWDTVRHSPAFELRAQEGDYGLGDPVYISSAAAGTITDADDEGEYVGRIVGDSGSDDHQLVSFSFDYRPDGGA